MKARIDIILTEEFSVKSRTAAQALIKAGCVSVDGKIIKKASEIIDSNMAEIEIINQESVLKYAGRGGYKLEKAIEKFSVSLNGLCCLDIGASTGGFTDCMLKNGAKRVFSVDVGHDQLAAELRRDERVVVLEGLDIRNVDDEIYEKVNFISIDVSFISLKLILPVIKKFVAENAECVALIKPQFEAGKQKLGKNGVIRDSGVHKKIVEDIIDFSSNLGFRNIKVIPSPIKGGDGNQEFLIHFNI